MAALTRDKGMFRTKHLLSIGIFLVLWRSSHTYPAVRCYGSKFLYKGLCCDLCSEGEQIARFCTETGVTECEPCPLGYFSDKPNSQQFCKRLNNCDKRNEELVMEAGDDRKSDNVCQCTHGYHYSVSGEICLENLPCLPGEGITDDGDCLPCLPGTFSDKTSTTEKCRPQPNCGDVGLTVIAEGNITSERVCGVNVHETVTDTKDGVSMETTTITTQLIGQPSEHMATSSSRDPMVASVHHMALPQKWIIFSAISTSTCVVLLFCAIGFCIFYICYKRDMISLPCFGSTSSIEFPLVDIGMDEKHRQLLRKYMPAFACNLPTDKVLEELSDVFTEEDEAEIHSMRLSVYDQRRCFIRILCTKGPDAFHRFIHVLRKVCPYLAKPLEDELNAVQTL